MSFGSFFSPSCPNIRASESTRCCRCAKTGYADLLFLLTKLGCPSKNESRCSSSSRVLVTISIKASCCADIAHSPPKS